MKTYFIFAVTVKVTVQNCNLTSAEITFWYWYD